MSERYVDIPIREIVLPPELVRVEVKEVDSLAENVKKEGIIEPLVVRLKNGNYELVCGLRRLKAAEMAGLERVPCIVKEMSDHEAMEAMLTENMQRESLTDYEVGRWFKMLMEKFPDKYPSQHAVADKFKIAQPYVARLIEHYEFLEEMKGKMPSYIMPRGIMLPEGFTREVRRAPEEIQVNIVKAIVKTMEKWERGEYEHPPTVRDIAKLTDSYIHEWERKQTEISAKQEALKGQEERMATEREEKPKTEPEAKPTAKPVSVKAEPKQVEQKLQHIIEKRVEAGKKRDELLTVALYRYYPEKFLMDVENICGENAPIKKVEETARNAIEIFWDDLEDEAKMNILREAASWASK